MILNEQPKAQTMSTRKSAVYLKGLKENNKSDSSVLMIEEGTLGWGAGSTGKESEIWE